MPAMLDLKNIVLQRGDFCLQVKHLRLEAGKLYTLQGENGAGKSSLLQRLALLQQPQLGSLQFAGQPIVYKAAALKHLRQQVTLLEQNPLLFSGTVEQNLAFVLKLSGIHGKERQQRIEQTLDTTGLQGFNQRPTDELSGGEARRVARTGPVSRSPAADHSAQHSDGVADGGGRAVAVRAVQSPGSARSARAVVYLLGDDCRADDSRHADRR